MHSGLVLIVDDEPKIRTLISKQLHACGIKTEPAGTADEALERVARADVALVIIDVHLQNARDGSGVDLMAKLRGLDPDMPFIFVTGDPGTVDDHPDVPCVIKPYQVRELVSHVMHALRMRCRDIQVRETHSLTSQMHKMLTGHIEKCSQMDLAELMGQYIVKRRRDPLVWGLVLIVCSVIFAIATEWTDRGAIIRAIQRKAP